MERKQVNSGDIFYVDLSPIIGSEQGGLRPFLASREVAVMGEEVVYEAEEIQTLLRIGRSKTYQFLDEVHKMQSPFRVLKIGKLYRVPKQSFDDWLNGNEAEVITDARTI